MIRATTLRSPRAVRTLMGYRVHEKTATLLYPSNQRTLPIIFTASAQYSTSTPTTAAAAAAAASSSLLPERNLWDTIYSGTKGIVTLVTSEDARQKFLDIVGVGSSAVINAEVLKQARFGNMLTLALFHDLQDPLFQKYGFDASDFLEGVRPALKNCHDTIGKLKNEFPEIQSKEERNEKLLQQMHQMITLTAVSRKADNDADGDDSGFPKIDNAWTEQAQKDPNSLAGQLSKMVSQKLFDEIYLTSELEALTIDYEVDSTSITNVALLSARAMEMNDNDDDDGDFYDGIEAVPAEPEAKSKDEEISTAIQDEEATMKVTSEETATPEKKEKEEPVASEAISDETLNAMVAEQATRSDGNPSEGKSKTFLERKREMEEQARIEAERDSTDAAVKMEATREGATMATQDSSSSESTTKEEEKDEVVSKATNNTPIEKQSTNNRDKTPVAAQIEVLYELNQKTKFKDAIIKEHQEDDDERVKKMLTAMPRNEMQILIGTFEGWLNGGPDGALQWRITHLRSPKSEFPGLT